MVDEINKNFEFTLKAPQSITHKERFSLNSIDDFKKLKEIGYKLKAKIILFQTPSSFNPTSENLERVEKFFEKIKRDEFVFVWEVRWKNTWNKEIVEKLFSKINVEQCIDPFRQKFSFNKKIIYYRIHGLGKRMYDYDFSNEELKILKEKIENEKRECYILFNNLNCYENALSFLKI